MTEERYDWLFARRPGSTRIELLELAEWSAAIAVGAQCFDIVDYGKRLSVEEACRMAREEFERMPAGDVVADLNMTFSDEQAMADRLLNGDC